MFLNKEKKQYNLRNFEGLYEKTHKSNFPQFIRLQFRVSDEMEHTRSYQS